MSEVVEEDRIPECPQGTKCHKEGCYENEHTPSTNNCPSKLARGITPDEKPIETDYDPESNEVGSKKEAGGTEHANAQVQQGELCPGRLGRGLLLAAGEEVQGEKLKEKTVLLRIVAWRCKSLVISEEYCESEQGGEDAQCPPKQQKGQTGCSKQEEALNDPDPPRFVNDQADEVQDVEQRTFVVPAIEIRDFSFQNALRDI